MLTSHTGLTIGWLCAILSLAQVQSCTPFANPIVWVAKPTRGCYALAGVQLPERCAGNVQFSSRRVPYNRGMSRLAKNFAKMLSALQQLQEELPAAHSLHNHSEDDHSEDMSR